MFKSFLFTIFYICGLSFAQAQQTTSIPQVFIRVGLPVATPFGWMDFCERNQAECQPSGVEATEIEANATNLQALEDINLWVNRRVSPVSDIDHWGVEDRWDIPTDGKGDCEDFALYKRKLLMTLGYQSHSLLMTIVLDERGEPHAVLMVKTTKGDYLMDNLSDRLVLWSRSPYRFVKRQSAENPNLWVSVAPPAESYHMVAR